MSQAFQARNRLAACAAVTALVAGCGQNPGDGASSAARTPIAAASPACPKAAPLACPSPPQATARAAAQTPPVRQRRHIARSQFRHWRDGSESSRSFSHESVSETVETTHDEFSGDARSDSASRSDRRTYAYAGIDERGFLVWPGKVEY